MIANAPYIESCVYDYFSTPIINEYIINTSKNEDCIDAVSYTHLTLPTIA